MRQIAVIGLGKLGSTVARELAQQGIEVIAIDEQKEHVESLKEFVTYAATLNGTDEAALRAMNVQDVDVAIVCVGEDVEANLLITLLLKKIGVKKIWARAINPLQQEILKALEVDSIINIEEEMGRLVARSLVTDNVTRHIRLSPGVSVAEVRVPEKFVGKTLREIDPRKAFGVNVVAIKKRVPDITELGERTFREETEHVPSPDAALEETDILVMVGPDEHIEEFSKA